MSVYTPVSADQLAGWLKGYAVGAPVALEPIAAGIENTNYFVTTTAGRYVLTLFERLPRSELDFYLGLMAHLARHGIPCPAPIADLQDRYLGTLNGKPAALVTRLEGSSLEHPGVAECEALGGLLARMHLAGRSFDGFLENPRGPKWRAQAAREVDPFLRDEERALLTAELAYQGRHRFADLPRGAVHADLFRDNTLFKDGRISGVIDFYFAGIDCLLFDIAVCANDWCLVEGGAEPGALDPARTRALLRGYAALRPLVAAEHEAWSPMLRAAALRFWVSRLHDKHLPRPGELVKVHDPDHFRTVLAVRVAGALPPWLD